MTFVKEDHPICATSDCLATHPLKERMHHPQQSILSEHLRTARTHHGDDAFRRDEIYARENVSIDRRGLVASELTLAEYEVAATANQLRAMKLLRQRDFQIRSDGTTPILRRSEMVGPTNIPDAIHLPQKRDRDSSYSVEVSVVGLVDVEYVDAPGS